MLLHQPHRGRCSAGGSAFETATTHGTPSSLPLATCVAAGGEEREVRHHRLGRAPGRGRQLAVDGPLAPGVPLAITWLAFGTVMLMLIGALSSGWSLAGNHHGAMCGWFIATTSSVVGEPVALALVGVRATACRRTRTRTSTASPGASAAVDRPARGRSWRSRAACRRRCTDCTGSRKSRSKLERSAWSRSRDLGPAREPAGAEVVAVVDVVGRTSIPPLPSSGKYGSPIPGAPCGALAAAGGRPRRGDEERRREPRRRRGRRGGGSPGHVSDVSPCPVPLAIFGLRPLPRTLPHLPPSVRRVPGARPRGA